MAYVCACAYTCKGGYVHACTCEGQKTTQGVHPQFPPCMRHSLLFAAAYPRQASLQASLDSSVFPPVLEEEDWDYRLLCRFCRSGLRSTHLHSKCFIFPTWWVVIEFFLTYYMCTYTYYTNTYKDTLPYRHTEGMSSITFLFLYSRDLCGWLGLY